MSHDGTGSTPRYAFVTLLTTDSYLPGALVLAHSLRRAHSLAHNPTGTLTAADIANLGPAGLSNDVDAEKNVDLICLVTPATVSVKSVKALVRAFDKVVGVEPLSFAGFAAAQIMESRTSKSIGPARKEERRAAKKARQHSRKMLALLGRPDLGEASGAALTKLHAWRLTGYQKIIFLDADMLVIRPLAHLFSIGSHLAASPDIGWPDAFNSGLMVLTPSLDTFSDICEFAISRGSWDGADQGLLNDYFGGDESSGETGRGGGWQRLPFRYNVTPNTGYTFAPAYQRYGRGIMAAHFIGLHKPWNRPRPQQSYTSTERAPSDHDTLLLRWHQAYEDYYPAATAKAIRGGAASVVHTERGVEVVETPFIVPTYRAVWDAESDVAMSFNPSEAGSGRVPSRIRGVRSRPSANSIIRGAGQAEDLREMFSSNIVDVSVAAEVANMTKNASRNSTEGIYISLPLNGRTSLMGVEYDSGAEQDSADSDETLNADRYGSKLFQGQERSSDPAGDEGAWSPPKVSWNPALEPPPTSGDSSGYQMRAPVGTFFVNAWDQDQQPKGKAAFFDSTPNGSESSSQGRTMARLQREHYFDNLGSDRPDPTLVKAVFPWESQQPTSSSRIFPDEDPVSVRPGSTLLDASLTAGSLSSTELISTPKLRSPLAGTPPVGQHRIKGMLPNLSYANAWDQVGGIKNERRQGSSRNVQTIQEEQQNQNQQNRSGRSSQQRNWEPLLETGSWEEGVMGQMGYPAGQGLRDSSADQSADGDDESSSSSSGENQDEDRVGGGGSGLKWKREKPGKGYQRKVGKYLEQSGSAPRSPRSQYFQPLHASGIVGTSGSMEKDHSISSSGSSNSPQPPIHTNVATPSTGPTGTTRGRRTRTSSGIAVMENEVVTPKADMSLSTSYVASALVPSQSGFQRDFTRLGLNRDGLYESQPGSNLNSGSNSPAAISTPLSRSPAISREDLRQLSRTHAQAQDIAASKLRRAHPR